MAETIKQQLRETTARRGASHHASYQLNQKYERLSQQNLDLGKSTTPPLNTMDLTLVILFILKLRIALDDISQQLQSLYRKRNHISFSVASQPCLSFFRRCLLLRRYRERNVASGYKLRSATGPQNARALP